MTPLRCAGAVAIMIGAGPVSAALPAPSEDSAWYYEIGGARALSAPATRETVSVPVGASVALGLGQRCGAFDPVLGVSHTLEAIRSGVDRMVDAMVLAATSAIASLPALILQRANPGLYDLFQNALLRAEAQVQLATKSCEQMEAEIARGKNPFDEWVVLSVGHDWRREISLGTGDVVSAKAAVDETHGARGVPWVGGPAGGAGQPSIHVVGDSLRAGWNVLLGRAPEAQGAAAATGPEAPRLAQVWDSPEAVREFGVGVLGDLRLHTCEGCPPEGIPGVGLVPEQDAATTALKSELATLVQGQEAPSAARLEAASAPGIALTRALIEALREFPAAEQAVLVEKLAGEVALARTVEKALLLRRVLLAGRQVPEIAASPAPAALAGKLAELDREIDNLLFEHRVHREVVSATAARVLEAARTRAGHSLTLPLPVPADPKPLIEGGAVAP